MNVYNEAHNLANAIKGCNEYIEYKKYEDQVNQNPELQKMIQDFQQKSMEMQMKQMQGEEIGPEQLAGVQSLFEIVNKDPVAAQYMQASMRFSLMMQDVFNIIGEATGMKFGI